MSTKTIPDLQLISNITDSLNIPGDDGSITYRLTAAQLWAYIQGKYSTPATISAAGTTLTSSNKTILLDPTSASFTQALPAVAGLPVGLRYNFKIIATNGNFVTLDGNSTELIDNAQTLVLNSNAGMDGVTLMNTGSKWLVM